MAGKKESTELWRQTVVLIRSDIFEQAQKEGIDISAECNRVLAERTGIDYLKEKMPEEKPAGPVIVADAPERAKVPSVAPAEAKLKTDIINADDPGAPRVVRSRRSHLAKPVQTPASETSKPAKGSEEIKSPPVPAISSDLPKKGPKKGKAAQKRGDPVKSFFSAMLSRDDSADAVITRDMLYAAFSGWCHDNRISPVPDKRTFAVSLKNRCAVQEKNTGGSSSWTGIRFKK